MPMFNIYSLVTVAIAVIMSAAFLGGTLVILDSISPLLTASNFIEPQQLA